MLNLIFPIVLGGGIAFWFFVGTESLDPASIEGIWFGLIFSLAMFAEVIFRGGFRFFKSTVKRDLTFMVIASFVGGSTIAGTIYLTGHLSSLIGRPAAQLPYMVALPLAFILSDFFYYIWHRATHQIPFLWRWHKVHHEPDEIYPMLAFVTHPVEIMLTTFLRLLPLGLLGFNAEVLLLHAMMFVITGVVNHSGLSLKAGWLNYFVQTPELHKLHHSTVQQEARNYSVFLTLWDHVFGTFVYKPQYSPRSYGLENPEQKANGVWASLKEPFRAIG